MSLSRVSLEQHSQFALSIKYCKGSRTELKYSNPCNHNPLDLNIANKELWKMIINNVRILKLGRAAMQLS